MRGGLAINVRNAGRSVVPGGEMKKILFALAVATLLVSSSFAGELLANPGFESGALNPWFTARAQFCFSTCIPWAVTNTVVHSGSFSATDVGNIEMQQNFTPTAGSAISSVSLWINNSAGVDAADFFYTDGSDQEFVFFSTPGIWNLVDLTSDVDTTKILSGFSVWGCSPDCVTYVDDASIMAATTTPEPGSLIMLGSGILAAAGALRRKLIS
jgi:hypothetical protein